MGDGGARAAPCRATPVAHKGRGGEGRGGGGGGKGRSEKSSAAYVGFRARLAATEAAMAAATTALIRVRRYEIIKLGLDGGEGNGGAGTKKRREERRNGGNGGVRCRRRMGRRMARGTRSKEQGQEEEEEDNRIPYTGIYERQPRRPFETRAATAAAVVAAEERTR